MLKPEQIKAKPTKVAPSFDQLEQINFNAAGLDIGAGEIWGGSAEGSG